MASCRSDSLAEEIKSRISMEDAARSYGFEPNRAGYICCPFHDERTASMKIYPDQGGFHCFGCGAHGSVIDFVMLLYRISFRQAIVRLNADFSLNLALEKPNGRARSEAVEKRRREAEETARYRREYDNRCILFRAFREALAGEKPKSFDDMTPLYMLALRYYSELEYWFEVHPWR